MPTVVGGCTRVAQAFKYICPMLRRAALINNKCPSLKTRKIGPRILRAIAFSSPLWRQEPEYIYFQMAPINKPSFV